LPYDKIIIAEEGEKEKEKRKNRSTDRS